MSPQETLFVGLCSIVVLGTLAQWLAWRLRLPSILLLLLTGILVGPLWGFLDPDRLLGDLLVPIVSLSVALILFEGGLSLRLSELKGIASLLWSLIFIGALVTWIISSLAARVILGLGWELAILLGGILVVTGPTVVLPLLRHVRPSGQVGTILKWEGIVIDPIGVLLAVLIFEVILSGGLQEATNVAVLGILNTVFVGGTAGVAGAGALTLILRKHWVPDFLQNAAALSLVVSCFAVSNFFQPESGLFAVTLMGVGLANQRFITVKHIIDFKENLRVLLISGIFILLASRLKFEDFQYLGWGSLFFLLVLIGAARPAAVFLTTLRSDLSLQEKVFLAWMAPRGVVAASVASIFAIRLEEAGIAQAHFLVPVTFTVIIGTVFVYGLTAFPLAQRLGLATANPQGVLFVGAHELARAVAAALKEQGFPVLMVDSNPSNIMLCRMAGLPAHHGNILSEQMLDELDLSGLGRLLALTPNEGVNSLASVHFADVFGRKEVYQLAAEEKSAREGTGVTPHLRGRILFSRSATYRALRQRLGAGATVKSTPITKELGYEAYKKMYGDDALPLFVVKKKELVVVTADRPAPPLPGQTLVALVLDRRRAEAQAERADAPGGEGAAAGFSATPPS